MSAVDNSCEQPSQRLSSDTLETMDGNWTMQLTRIWCGLCLLAITSGCYNLHDDMDGMFMSTRCRWAAKHAWRDMKDVYADVDCNGHFGSGFRDGYYAVATGGSATPPVLPPRRYWTSRYTGPDGQPETIAWFDGYSHGALAAEQDGYAFSRQVTISPLVHHRMTSTPQPQMTDSAVGPDGVPMAPPAPADAGDAGIDPVGSVYEPELLNEWELPAQTVSESPELVEETIHEETIHIQLVPPAELPDQSSEVEFIPPVPGGFAEEEADDESRIVIEQLSFEGEAFFEDEELVNDEETVEDEEFFDTSE